MGTSLSILLAFTVLHSADLSQPGPNFDIKQAQNWMIRRALNEVSSRLIRIEADAGPDVCAWKFIECTNDIVTVIFLQIENARIEVEWLPPTLEFIHIRYIQVIHENPFPLLPRKLKYLYVGFFYRGIAHMDFSNLPDKMEELILKVSAYDGEICLRGMPQTMRYVYIEQVTRYTNAIIVDYSSLAVSVEEIRVTSKYNDYKIRRRVRAIGKPGDVTLQTKYDKRYPTKGSKYFESFQQRFTRFGAEGGIIV